MIAVVDSIYKTLDTLFSSSDGKRLGRSGGTIKQGNTAATLRGYHRTIPMDSIIWMDEEELGSGHGDEVLLATDGHGTKLAVQSFDKDAYSEPELDFLRREVSIHMNLDHPHILRLAHVFESDCSLQLVTEFMEGGDLYSAVCERGVLTEQEAILVVTQILLAVSYLHDHKIIHRNLKLENILFKDTERTHVKVMDFGKATYWDGETGVSEKVGTPCCFAPEMWTTDYTNKIDIWAVGLMVYELLIGHSAFSQRGRMEEVRRGEVRYEARFANLSSDAQDFIRSLLAIDPEKRPSALECLRHPWLHSAVLESPNPEVRMMRSLLDLAHQTHCRRVCLKVLAFDFTSEEQGESQAKSPTFRQEWLHGLVEEADRINRCMPVIVEDGDEGGDEDAAHR